MLDSIICLLFVSVQFRKERQIINLHNRFDKAHLKNSTIKVNIYIYYIKASLNQESVKLFKYFFSLQKLHKDKMSSSSNNFQYNQQQQSKAQLEGQQQFSKSKSSLSKARSDILLNAPTRRKTIPLFMYLLWTFVMLVLSFQNILFFFSLDSDLKAYYAMFSLTSIIIILVMISKYFTTFQEMLNLYFLIDTCTLSLIASIIGFIGMVQPAKKVHFLFGTTIQYLVPIVIFCGTGNIRIMIKFANFSRWQNVVFKMVIFLDGMCYFMIGIYIMYYDHKISRGMDPETDSFMKSFSLLFVFGTLALYKQYCNLHNRFDQTDRLKYSYKLVDYVQQQEDFVLFEQRQQKKEKKTSLNKINSISKKISFKFKKKQFKQKTEQD